MGVAISIRVSKSVKKDSSASSDGSSNSARWAPKSGDNDAETTSSGIWNVDGTDDRNGREEARCCSKGLELLDVEVFEIG